MELCVRVMLRKQPANCAPFIQLLLQTELLEYSWFPLMRDCALFEITHHSSSAMQPNIAVVISLHVSLMKMFKQKYADLNIADTNDAAVAFDAYALSMHNDVQKLVRCCLAYIMGAVRSGRECAMSDSHCTQPECHSSLGVSSAYTLLLVLVRFWVQLAVTHSSTRPDITSVCSQDWVQLLKIESLLKACGFNLLAFEGQGHCADFAQIAGTWEAYTLSCVHGRVLPGCSYWDCINLHGFSEAGLTTLLCSGCRRVRYCCQACQRAAWVQGHREYCQSLERH